MNSDVRQRTRLKLGLPAKRRRGWRAHREIKGYAGGSEHCTVVDECVDADREWRSSNRFRRRRHQTQPSATQPAPPQAVQNDTTGQPGLPQAPAPKLTEPLYLRDTGIDYTKPKSHFWNPIAPYTATNVPAPRLGNTPRLEQLLQDGKIYLSLSDAVTLALRTTTTLRLRGSTWTLRTRIFCARRRGRFLRGVSTGLVQNTLGGTTQTILSGGGPGATSAGTGGGGAGVGGMVLSTNGGGPTPEALDPVLTGQLSYEAQNPPQLNTLFSGGLSC